MGIFDFLDRIYDMPQISPPKPNKHTFEIDLSDINSIVKTIVFGDWYKNNGSGYCDECEFGISSEEYRFISTFFLTNNKIFSKSTKTSKECSYNICCNCAKSKEDAAKIIKTKIENQIKGTLNMRILETLKLERERLVSQLTELTNIKLPENMPTHILEHLQMKSSLLGNCIKSIQELEENYKLDETIKKLFAS